MTTGEGLYCLDEDTERFGPCTDLGALPAVAMTTAAHDASGDLWLASLEGVWHVSQSAVQAVPMRAGVGTAGDDVYTLLGERCYLPVHRQPGSALGRHQLRIGSAIAQASTVEVRFEPRDDHLEIEITDDGQGFDADHLLTNPNAVPGNGLRNLRDRTQALAGIVTIESRRDEGTRLLVRVPLHQTA